MRHFDDLDSRVIQSFGHASYLLRRELMAERMTSVPQGAVQNMDKGLFTHEITSSIDFFLSINARLSGAFSSEQKYLDRYNQRHQCENHENRQGRCSRVIWRVP